MKNQNSALRPDGRVCEPGPIGRWPALLGVLVLGACASMPDDLGRGEVDTWVSARGYPVDARTSPADIEALVRSLVAAPMTPGSAVRIALVNNPRLQATYASLGFGAADVYEAGRIRNPIFGVAFLRPDAPGDDQLTLSLAVAFTDLITLSARRRLAGASFAALKQTVGAEVLATAAEAERAYYEYVAARQLATLRAKVTHAGHLAATLAERFHDAGNLSARELALERAAAAQFRLESIDAEREALSARRALAGVLGLSIGDAWEAPAALPLPVAHEDDLDTLLARARDSRLDLSAARANVQLVADRYGVVNWTRWLGELEVGVEREREVDGEHLTGPFASWELPIFDRGGEDLLRAQAEWQIAIAEVRRITMDVDNEIRLSHALVASARSRVDTLRDALIPERIAVVARAQEEVNYMLIGVFDLIAAKQEEYDAYQAYLDSIRDYWLARVELRRAAGGALLTDAPSDGEQFDVDALLQPPTNVGDHANHGAHGAETGPRLDEPGNEAHSQHAPTDADVVPQEPADHSHHGHHGD